MKIKYGCDEKEIGNYICHRTTEKITVDGNLLEETWQKSTKSPRFVDMVTGEPGFWDTRMASVWDDRCLYIAFWVEEPNIRAEFTKRDSPVYMENDVEVFIDGKDCYYEFQINARGTIYEVFYIWQDEYKKNRRFHMPEFDLARRNIDIIGGFQDETRYCRHPKGKRWAFMDWDFPDLKSAVRIEGTLNDSTDVDKGWTVELAFPWEGMKLLAGDRSVPPKNGDIWRFDISRFELLECNGIRFNHHPGWSFNKHGVYDSHIPECFTYVHFSDERIV